MGPTDSYSISMVKSSDSATRTKQLIDNLHCSIWPEQLSQILILSEVGTWTVQYVDLVYVYPP